MSANRVNSLVFAPILPAKVSKAHGSSNVGWKRSVKFYDGAGMVSPYTVRLPSTMPPQGRLAPKQGLLYGRVWSSDGKTDGRDVASDQV